MRTDLFMNENQNNPINKARQAAEKARAYEIDMQRAAEREQRMLKDEQRKNIPLVKPRRVDVNQKNNNAQRTANSARPAQGNRQRRAPQSAPAQQNRRRQYEQPMNNGFQEQVAEYERESLEYRKNGYGFFTAIVSTLVSIGLIGMMWLFNVLPMTPRAIVSAVLILLCIIIFILASRGQYSRKTRISGNIIGTIFLLLLIAIAFLMIKGVGFLNSVQARNETVSFEARVMQDSPIQSIQEIDGKAIAVVSLEKEDNIKKAIDSISTKNGITITAEQYPSYPDAINALYQGQVEVILFNNAKLETVKEAFPEFENETRVLYTELVEKEIQDIAKSVNTSKESFNLYISGIDTYGEIESVSRSDVNIVMTVNPNEKTILLTNIPRDTYVPIYGTGGGQDKLTHAGIFGIETSVRTLEEFLNTEINYFARVNFTSLIELVDVLGGIELDNPEEFTTRDGKHYFPAGTISLNGEEALAYSRERYNLAEGDIGRGKNQQRVIEAMVKKATQPSIISQADELMSRFNEVAETNMPAKDISNLVNVQLSNSKDWEFESVTLEGTGRMDLPSYNMPGYELYMYEPDPASVQELQTKIQEALNK